MVTANATAARGENPEEVKATATVEALQDPGISITKNVVEDKAYVLGETIEYTITVENTGNLTLYDITIEDEMTGGSWTIDKLAPGANQEFETSYTVKVSDVVAESITNKATVSGLTPKEETVEDKADVTVKTKKIKIVITADSDSKVYDGTPLTKNSYKLTSGTLATGDKIDFVCDYYTYNGVYEDSYYLGETLVITDPDNIKISNTYLGGDYLALYRITDIYNGEYWTETVPE